MNRDLDAKIAQDIFGWVLVPVSADANGENACEVLAPSANQNQDFYNSLPLVGKPHVGFACRRYSCDWSEAIKLAKHVKLDVPIRLIPDSPMALAEMCYNWWSQSEINPAVIGQ